ncbi:hypothetical protein [Bradyrhizobium sp. Tv2a-2]|uniref:hypothetical protein n=1 Tax=Bradyrhizobium sp. Tv2a-2 TaxID=113395 RepID=UPI00041D82A7|nr:hypothetical protein [Bradyrhizobium sp. Tv2a-2]
MKVSIFCGSSLVALAVVAAFLSFGAGKYRAHQLAVSEWCRSQGYYMAVVGEEGGDYCIVHDRLMVPKDIGP